MPEPEGVEKERFVFGVTAAGVEALRARQVDGERATISDGELDKVQEPAAVQQ